MLSIVGNSTVKSHNELLTENRDSAPDTPKAEPPVSGSGIDAIAAEFVETAVGALTGYALDALCGGPIGGIIGLDIGVGLSGFNLGRRSVGPMWFFKEIQKPTPAISISNWETPNSIASSFTGRPARARSIIF